MKQEFGQMSNGFHAPLPKIMFESKNIKIKFSDYFKIDLFSLIKQLRYQPTLASKIH